MPTAVADGAVSATSALDAGTLDIIKAGFSTMQGTVLEVVGIAVVSAVAVICLTAGVNYALKKIKGVIAKAS